MYRFELNKIELLFFILITLFLIFVFYPLEVFSDGTDFLMGGYFLGISHPPSYPVHTQLIHLTKYIPIGSLVLRTNLFTVVFSICFLIFFYKYLSCNIYERFLCLSIILFSYTFLINSINGEVYILNVLLIFLIFFLSEKEDVRFLYLNAFLLGIGMGVHHTIIFAGLYVCIKYIFEKRKISLSDIFISLFFFILGFSVYLYLPIRAVKEPLWNWGNPKSLTLFLNSFFRYDFQAEGFLRDFYILFQQAITFNPFYEFGVINGLLLLLALIYLMVYQRKIVINSFVFIMVFYIGFLFIVGSDKLDFEERIKTYGVFYLPAYIMLVYIFSNFIKSFKFQYKKIIFIISILGMVYNLYHISSELNYSKMVFPHDYGRMSLSMLPRENSVLIVLGGEKDFPIIYQQKICKFREDVKVIQLNLLGKIWNLKESLKLGVAYKPFDTHENGDKGIIKSVILYQKEVKGKRVFTNIFNNNELPNMNWDYNGIFQELDMKRKLDREHYLRLRGRGGDDNFIENILKLDKS
jgi:hypothetical protein